MNFILLTIIHIVAYIHNKCECLHVSLYYWERIRKHKIAIWTLVYCHTFPLSTLSFPLLHVSTVSLLSKKGLRYLLYPFISLWMVGGRISPSFTSAFSMELSNSLRTKREWNSEKLKSKFFVCVVPLVAYLKSGVLSHLCVHTICRVLSENRANHVQWKTRKGIKRAAQNVPLVFSSLSGYVENYLFQNISNPPSFPVLCFLKLLLSQDFFPPVVSGCYP